jgi:hypothetical protein
VEEWKSNSNLLIKSMIKSSLAADITPTPHELSVDDYEPSWQAFVPLGDPGSAGSGSSVVARAGFPDVGGSDSTAYWIDLAPTPTYLSARTGWSPRDGESLLWDRWMRKTIRKITMVVPVLTGRRSETGARSRPRPRWFRARGRTPSCFR